MESIPTKRTAKSRGPYRKSRKGCRNCRLRKVKCDETKPHCRKCQVYGVLCNYGREVADLKLPAEGTDLWVLDVPSANTSSGLSLVRPCSHTLWGLDNESLKLFDFFRTHTLRTIGDSAISDLYETEVLRLASCYPFITHAVVAVAAAHHRYLKAPERPRRSVLETYHSCQCTASFVQQLDQAMKPQDLDPLWAVAALLGVITFSSFDAACPEEAWPLRKPDSSDLQWLRISDGKMAIWKLTNPMRPNSIFSKISHIYVHMGKPLPPSGIDRIPPAFAHVCNLTKQSTADSNPYFTALHIITWLYSLPAENVNAGDILLFISRIEGPFKKLLENKDPVALLLVAWLYTKTPLSLWWMQPRAILECEAVCIYLRSFHTSRRDILELLPDKNSVFPWGEDRMVMDY